MILCRSGERVKMTKQEQNGVIQDMKRWAVTRKEVLVKEYQDSCKQNNIYFPALRRSTLPPRCTHSIVTEQIRIYFQESRRILTFIMPLKSAFSGFLRKC